MKYLEKEMIEVNNKIEELISSNDKNMQDVIDWVLHIKSKRNNKLNIGSFSCRYDSRRYA